MPNSKAVGVAYSDPEFESITITGAQQFGNESTSLVGFYGATPVDQPATIASVTTGAITSVTTTAATSTTPYGYLTSTQADAIVVGVNALITRAALQNTQGNAVLASLKELGLIASS